VDQKYKNKHFPKPPPKPTQATPSKDASELASKAEQPQSMKDLIASFSVMSIAPAPPEVEGMPPPPCPLAALPEEILVHILRDVAVLDVGDFMRLARVCKRLAYLVATEDRIWRRICLGSEFGFGGMHYYWQRQVAWGPITEADLLREATEAEEASSAAAADSSAASSETAPPPVLPHPPLTLAERAERHAQESTATTLALYRSLYGRSWQRMFRQRPRIRFNGCYISTVNYLRSGQASPNQATWGSPVHIVTYYRYLRFFRDGTVLSLTETAEPGDVVHHLTREAVAQQSAAVLKQVLKGRWRLASARADADSSNSSSPAGEVVEGDVTVETEGVAKYIYRLDLALGSAGKGARNNKLGWKGFYSYNTLTGDWAEFTMRNNKPFFFSRVRSYGVRGA
jgi:F-box protein 9